MPCCAFAAFVIGQFILAYAAVKRTLFGVVVDERNAAVEWRLDAPIAAAPRPALLRSRRAIGGLALAAAVELLLIFGAIHGLTEHLRHGADHAAHVHTQEAKP